MKPSFSIVGLAIGRETFQVQFNLLRQHDNGVDIQVVVTSLEYQFSLTTFFYGFNLSNFVETGEKLRTDQVSKLINYDESLCLEFGKDPNSTFVSMHFRSVLPDRRDKTALRPPGSSIKEDESFGGSRFSFVFMKMDSQLGEFIEWVEEIITNYQLEIGNPYGG
jgi:hypothetical protein